MGNISIKVYQENVYGDAEFLSFKKVLSTMPFPYNQVELISFYSCSKGKHFYLLI
jgi:alanine transaminase